MVKAALDQLEETPEEEEQVVVEEEENSGSEDDDGICGFGAGSKDKQEDAQKPAPKRRRTTGASGGGSGGTGGQASKRKASGQDGDVPNLVKNAQSCMAAVQSITPLQVWQGSIRLKEADKRLHAATEALTMLEEHVLLSPEAQDASKKLTDVCAECTEFLDVLVPLLSDTCVSYVKAMDRADIISFGKFLPADCASAVLVDLGKRLLEAGWLVVYYGIDRWPLHWGLAACRVFG